MSLIGDRLRLIENYYEEASITKLYNHKDFDRVLKIVIPGDPVSDGRPRENKALQVFYNAKKEFLRNIYKAIYKKDKVLRKTCIITPLRIEIKCYSIPTKKDLQYLSNEELESESIASIGNKDNDNVEKVNWDILQDTQFMVILNDSAVINNETFKFYSFNPRTEIYLYYSSYFRNTLYKAKITNSMEYKFYLCSKKYLIDQLDKTTPEVIEYLSLHLPRLKSKAQKKLKYLIEPYSAEVIDGLYKFFIFDGLSTDIINAYVKRINKKDKIAILINILKTASPKVIESIRIKSSEEMSTLKDKMEGKSKKHTRGCA